MFSVAVIVALNAVVSSVIAIGVYAVVRRRARRRELLGIARIQHARQVERAQVALVHSERQSALERIASGVAHEVNNPAGFILANLDQIRRRLVIGDPVCRDIDDCIDGVRRIRSIVSALRALTRGDDAPTESVQLETVVENALMVGTPSVPQGVEIIRRLDPVGPFESRPGTIMRIALDLAAHAAVNIPAGEPGRIEISTRCEGEVALIEVAEVHARATTMPDTETHQIRLEVVRQSLRSLDGALSVATRADGGMVRTARIPMPPARRQEPDIAPTTGPTRRGTVLLIDDEPALIRVLGRVVGRAHEAVTALSGNAAEAIIHERRDSIDLIVCDVILGDTNGLEMRERAAEIAPALADRFVFMTGGGLAVDLLQRIHRTGCPILEKPLEPDELLEFIASRLARSN